MTLVSQFLVFESWFIESLFCFCSFVVSGCTWSMGRRFISINFNLGWLPCNKCWFSRGWPYFFVLH